MPEFIFVIDPMCSWCWGFHPVMEELRHKYSNSYKFSLIAGGLRTFSQMEWNEQSKMYLKQNWDAVAKKQVVRIDKDGHMVCMNGYKGF